MAAVHAVRGRGEGKSTSASSSPATSATASTRRRSVYAQDSADHAHGSRRHATTSATTSSRATARSTSDTCETKYDCADQVICDKGFCATAMTKAVDQTCGNPGDVCGTGNYCAQNSAQRVRLHAPRRDAARPVRRSEALPRGAPLRGRDLHGSRRFGRSLHDQRRLRHRGAVLRSRTRATSALWACRSRPTRRRARISAAAAAARERAAAAAVPVVAAEPAAARAAWWRRRDGRQRWWRRQCRQRRQRRQRRSDRRQRWQRWRLGRHRR